MRQHAPETLDQACRSRGAEPGNVAFEKIPHVAVPPLKALAVAARIERSRQAAPQPQSVRLRNGKIGRGQRGQFVARRKICERFKAFLELVRLQAAEQEKAGRTPGTHRQFPHRGQQRGGAMDLIQNDQAPEMPQGESRIFKLVSVGD